MNLNRSGLQQRAGARAGGSAAGVHIVNQYYDLAAQSITLTVRNSESAAHFALTLARPQSLERTRGMCAPQQQRIMCKARDPRNLAR